MASTFNNTKLENVDKVRKRRLLGEKFCLQNVDSYTRVILFAVSDFYTLAKRNFFSRRLICPNCTCVNSFCAKFFGIFLAFLRNKQPFNQAFIVCGIEPLLFGIRDGCSTSFSHRFMWCSLWMLTLILTLAKAKQRDMNLDIIQWLLDWIVTQFWWVFQFYFI